MDRLGGEIGRQLDRLSPVGSGDMAALVRAWPLAVGEENARRAWPARLGRDGTLHVNATDSTWAFQLGMLADAILARLREHVGEATPPALRFVPGPIPEAAAGVSPRGVAQPPMVAPEDNARAAEVAAEIEDVELRQTVVRAAAASLARARADRGF